MVYGHTKIQNNMHVVTLNAVLASKASDQRLYIVLRTRCGSSCLAHVTVLAAAILLNARLDILAVGHYSLQWRDNIVQWYCQNFNKYKVK